MLLTSILDRLPYELAARLESDPFFQDIPVVVAVKGNVAREYQRKQAVITEKSGKRGVCVIVLQVVADDIYFGLAAGPMKLKPAFQVIENVELNNDDAGTHKSARKIARHIVLNMKLATIGGLVQGIKCATPCIEPADIKELGEATVSEQVNFECQEISSEQINYCLPPTCSQVAGQLQLALASATPGAAIWYTTDGSYPYPWDESSSSSSSSSTSQLYTGPIPVALNTTIQIRCCAYQPGYIASSVMSYDVTITTA